MARNAHLEQLPRRIFGIETEYGILAAAVSGGAPVVDADTAGRVLFHDVLARSQSTSVFLPNGSRLYLDVGSHPEYATAECLSLDDVLNQDRAGSEILADMAGGASERLSAQTGTKTQVHLFKNNLDAAGHSCGCHENYLLYRDGKFRSLVDSLVSFLVARQVFTGAGALLRIQGETRFCFSQRAFQIDDAVSAATTSTRPLVNTRDEPHADAKRYRRLHVIVGDSNVLEPPTRFKIATMNLLLAALESGVDFSDLALVSPIAALRDITSDVTSFGGQVRVELTDGRRYSALDVQEVFRDRLSDVFSGAELGAGYREVLDQWGQWLEALRNQDLEVLTGQLDWATKLSLLNGLRQRHNLALDDPKIARLDLAYHDITPGGLRLDQRGLATRLTRPDAVEAAKNVPPQNTRAKVRGAFIAAAREHRADLQADWTHLRLPESGLGTVTLSDPFAVDSAEVDMLMKTMEAA